MWVFPSEARWSTWLLFGESGRFNHHASSEPEGRLTVGRSPRVETCEQNGPGCRCVVSPPRRHIRRRWLAGVESGGLWVALVTAGHGRFSWVVCTVEGHGVFWSSAYLTTVVAVWCQESQTLSGCLVIVLNMLFFFFFFKMLSSTSKNVII